MAHDRIDVGGEAVDRQSVKMAREIHRILFLRTDRIGDVLMNLPAIHLLRQTFPKAWLAVCLSDFVADLLKGHPDIDELMIVDTKKMEADFGYRWQLILRVRKARFDLALVSNPDKFLHSLVFLAGIPQRIGYKRKWSFLLNKTMIDNKSNGARHEMDLNLDLVSLASDKAWDGTIRLPVDFAASTHLENLLAKDGLSHQDILAVHVGTSNPEKRWSAKSFAKLCDLVQSDGSLRVVLVGGVEEKTYSSDVASLSQRPLIDWTGLLKLQDLAALFNHPRVRALVSSDSGPVHIAWISGTPVVALYAKNAAGSNPARWGPRDHRSEVIYKSMKDISADEVYASLRNVLQKCGKT